ncbi:glycosyltransferase [Patulibacter defluvii]|uniref:glycosyltransferase n=1 Tax=Patulibacter defluvii TaxID=3095358 RepID=UPI002A754925|nr:glycosyltransferase [Patulibacter sp. DM4]
MPAPEVSVVVPVRDAAGDLRTLMAALAAQVEPPPFEVVVVDDGSSDDVDGALAGAPFPVRRLAVAAPGAAPAGPGAARDAAVAAADGELLAFTDADCRPAPGWLAAIVAPLRDGPCVVQGPIRVPDGSDVGPFDRTVQRPWPSPLFETANLAARRADVRTVGGFAGGVRPLGGKEMGEDVALGRALLRAGLALAWAPDAVVVHPVEPRDWRAAAWERARSGAFCALVARWPELRADLLHRRWFLLHDRPAAWLATAAAVGVVTAPLAPRGRRAATLALAGAASLPYLRGLDRRSRRWGRRRQPAIAAGMAAGDAVAGASLAVGSLRERTLVL